MIYLDVVFALLVKEFVTSPHYKINSYKYKTAVLTESYHLTSLCFPPKKAVDLKMQQP